jgi:hypothetical protein
MVCRPSRANRNPGRRHHNGFSTVECRPTTRSALLSIA